VEQDCISQTSYYRDRRGDGFSSADGSWADPYAGEVAVSIVLCGTDGSALRHQLRTGLPPADPPAGGVLPDEPVSRTSPVLVTHERGLLLSAEIDPVGVRNQDSEATRLTIYLSRGDQVYQVPAFEVICELLHRRGIAGATVLEGAGGSLHGGRGERELSSRHAANPMMIVAVSSGGMLGLLLPELAGLLRRPLFTLETVRVCKRDGQLVSHPLDVPAAADDGDPLWRKLAVYACGSARHGGLPAHRAIIRGLRAGGIGSAVTVRGVWGFHGDQAPHGGSHHPPAVTVVAGAPAQIRAAFQVIDEITAGHGLVTCNTVTGSRVRAEGTSRGWYTRRTRRLLRASRAALSGWSLPAAQDGTARRDARISLVHIKGHSWHGRVRPSQLMPWCEAPVSRTAACCGCWLLACGSTVAKELFRVPESPADLRLPPLPGRPAGNGSRPAAAGTWRQRVLPRADWREITAIFAGGALGTLARAALSDAFPRPATSWPWPTFGVNIAAAFLLGYFVTRLQERLPLSSYRRPLLGTGLCGGLSTFSTMQVEIVKMLGAHAWGLAAGYTAASICGGYAAIHLASAMVRRARVCR